MRVHWTLEELLALDHGERAAWLESVLELETGSGQ
jgi:hypothetical protein